MFRLRSKLLFLTLFLSAALVGFEPPVFADTPGVDRPLRILHIMSFDSPWRWTDGQLAGFTHTAKVKLSSMLTRLS